MKISSYAFFLAAIVAAAIFIVGIPHGEAACTVTGEYKALLGCFYEGKINGFAPDPVGPSNTVLEGGLLGPVLETIPTTGKFILLDFQKSDLEKRGTREDRFSTRWAGTFQFPAGIYRFSIEKVDDEAVILVDGAVVAYQWGGSTALSGDNAFQVAGSHKVDVRFYENTGDSFIKITGQRIGAAPAPSTPPAPQGTPSSGGTTGQPSGTGPAVPGGAPPKEIPGKTETPVSSGLSFSPSSLSFGAVAAGQSKILTTTLTNNNTTGLISVSISATGQFRCTDGCNHNLAAGQSGTVTVTFSPVTEGSTAGQLLASSYATAALAGNGVASAKAPGASQQKRCDIVCPPGAVCIENPLNACKLSELIDGIINFLFTISLVVAPIMVIVGGFMFVTGGGDPLKIAQGKRLLLWTVIGFSVILLSKGFVTILRKVLGI